MEGVLLTREAEALALGVEEEERAEMAELRMLDAVGVGDGESCASTPVMPRKARRRRWVGRRRMVDVDVAVD